MTNIDLKNTKKLRSFLSETDEGKKALSLFRTAIDDLRGTVSDKANDAEFTHVLKGLVNSLKLDAVPQHAGVADLGDEVGRIVEGGFMVNAAE